MLKSVFSLHNYQLPFLDNCNEKLHAFNVAPPMPSDDTNYHDLIYNGGLSLSLSLRSFCEFLEVCGSLLPLYTGELT